MWTILGRPILAAPQMAAALGMLQVLQVLVPRRRSGWEVKLADLNDHLLRDIGVERGPGIPHRPAKDDQG